MHSQRITPQESLFLSYAKAIGILLVVIGHYRWLPPTLFHPYIFHMPLFFMVGGILAKPASSVAVQSSKVTKSLGYVVIHYLLIGGLTMLTNSTFGTSIDVAFVGDGESSLGALTFPLERNMHNNSLFLVAWFVLAYLAASQLFGLVLALVSRIWTGQTSRWVALALGLIGGWYGIDTLGPRYAAESRWVDNFTCQVLVGMMYFSVGHAVRPHLWVFRLIPVLLVSGILFISLAGQGLFPVSFMSWSQYPAGFWIQLVSSLLACACVLCLAYLASMAVRSSFLEVVGRRSRDIMTWHVLVHVGVDLAFCGLGKYGYDEVKALSHYSSPGAWPFYIFAGVMIPIAIGVASDSIWARWRRAVSDVVTALSSQAGDADIREELTRSGRILTNYHLDPNPEGEAELMYSHQPAYPGAGLPCEGQQEKVDWLRRYGFLPR
ncbi:MAG: hypothetical protein P1V35_05445 [Planctomycetota bacterium]|nr:hypothetical protein [Planctomycetota bacterium]